MKIDLIAIIGAMTIVSSFALKFIGFPSQIRTIQKSKSTEGVSLTLFVIAFINYILWTLHGVVKNDWVTIIGQGIGIFVSGIALYLIWKKRRTIEK